jgi:hypothetical protein
MGSIINGVSDWDKARIVKLHTLTSRPSGATSLDETMRHPKSIVYAYSLLRGERLDLRERQEREKEKDEPKRWIDGIEGNPFTVDF